MDIHILIMCPFLYVRHLQFPFFILRNNAIINILKECPTHMYVCISIGQTPRSVIIGVKGMCVKKIQNSAKSPSSKATLIYTVTRNLEWISSQHLTC